MEGSTVVTPIFRFVVAKDKIINSASFGKGSKGHLKEAAHKKASTTDFEPE